MKSTTKIVSKFKLTYMNVILQIIIGEVQMRERGQMAGVVVEHGR